MTPETLLNAAESFAERYDRVMVPVIFRPWAQELLRSLAPGSRDRVLDLGCGTGAVSRTIMAEGYAPKTLTGVDMNAEMLDVAELRARDQGISVDWREAEASALPFEAGQFDIAYCQQALQFFPDKTAALSELRRVLRPEGRVAFCVSRQLSENPLLEAQAHALASHVGPDSAAAVEAICSLYDPDEIARHFDNAGFSSIRITRVSLTLHHPDGRVYADGAMAGMHTGDKLSALSERAREACIDTFLQGLGEYFDGQAITFPHVSNVITAHA
ncbi:class I SAM-dependent methyltransferase [Celeribacter litoreus]|uniref:class I SAM-dependent methyltransferase n=1 Tax=Celeribacter litoreus TaxID=2876714 RepID=UPI001CCAE060|nr:methyltransferase domain-containing protein [Celeribacter litoreus]MCA0042828.1 methyltransferase domain-containing protein [Celeribacter litoreus]